MIMLPSSAARPAPNGLSSYGVEIMVGRNGAAVEYTAA
jgi:hypothetical protein